MPRNNETFECLGDPAELSRLIEIGDALTREAETRFRRHFSSAARRDIAYTRDRLTMAMAANSFAQARMEGTSVRETLTEDDARRLTRALPDLQADCEAAFRREFRSAKRSPLSQVTRRDWFLTSLAAGSYLEAAGSAPVAAA